MCIIACDLDIMRGDRSEIIGSMRAASSSSSWFDKQLMYRYTTSCCHCMAAKLSASMLSKARLQHTHIHTLQTHGRGFSWTAWQQYKGLSTHLQSPPITSFSVFLNCCKDAIFSVGIMKYSMLSLPPSVVRVFCFSPSTGLSYTTRLLFYRRAHAVFTPQWRISQTPFLSRFIWRDKLEK